LAKLFSIFFPWKLTFFPWKLSFYKQQLDFYLQKFCFPSKSLKALQGKFIKWSKGKNDPWRGTEIRLLCKKISTHLPVILAKNKRPPTPRIFHFGHLAMSNRCRSSPLRVRSVRQGRCLQCHKSEQGFRPTQQKAKTVWVNNGVSWSVVSWNLALDSWKLKVACWNLVFECWQLQQLTVAVTVAISSKQNFKRRFVLVFFFLVWSQEAKKYLIGGKDTPTK
jgi:hypothetical protein